MKQAPIFEDAENEQIMTAFAPLKEVRRGKVYCDVYDKEMPVIRGRCLCGKKVNEE